MKCAREAALSSSLKCDMTSSSSHPQQKVGTVPEYIFRYPSSLEHYTAKTFVVLCFDSRFQEAETAFLRNEGIVGYRDRDLESPAGGGKIFFDPEEETDREYYCRELEKSTALHHAEEVWLFTHHDCGAYGGFRRFGNSRDEQFAFHVKGHKMARGFIAKRFSSIKKVRTFFVDEYGVIETTCLNES